MMWFLLQDIYNALYKTPVSAVVQAELQTRAQLIVAQSEIMVVAGNTASIAIEGVLTAKPDFFARLIGPGNTTYANIIEALATAEADSNITQIELMINSPGGNVDGMMTAMEAIAATKKPVTAIVSLAASAAYGLASQADSIIAVNDMSTVGSIGVMTEQFIAEDIIAITNTESPDKAPDASTPEGKVVIQAYLDQVFDVFIAGIATGRNTTVENATENFGRGALFLADAAQAAGMIDSIATPAVSAIQSMPVLQASQTAVPIKGENMTLEELRAQHPALFAQVVALGLSQGVTQERDRVVAHLTYANAEKVILTAFTAVKAGEGITEELRAKYMMAAMNNQDLNARGDDNAQGDLNDNGTPDQQTQQVQAKATVLRNTAAQLGMSLTDEQVTNALADGGQLPTVGVNLSV